MKFFILDGFKRQHSSTAFPITISAVNIFQAYLFFPRKVVVEYRPDHVCIGISYSVIFSGFEMKIFFSVLEFQLITLLILKQVKPRFTTNSRAITSTRGKKGITCGWHNLQLQEFDMQSWFKLNDFSLRNLIWILSILFYLLYNL